MKTILVSGSGTLALAIAQRLREAGAQVERAPDVSATEISATEQAALEAAAVLVLAADSDSGNVDLALQARRKNPKLALVVRLFDSGLAAYLAETISGIRILSMARVSAPVFVDAARRALAAPRPPASPRAPSRRAPRRMRADPVLLAALLSLLLLVFPSALVFSRALNLRYIDALYFVWTTVMTVGYGDIALKDTPDGIKVFGMLLMLAGASFIAVLFALLSDWVLGRRLDLLRGRTRVRGAGHVLIAGAGNLGLRVAELLAEGGPRLLILERNADNRNLASLKAMGRQVIIADATNPELLELAGLRSAALVVAVTDADAVNLQIALHAREHAVPVIMRVVSPELSAHVTQRGEWVAFSPVLAAAEAFAQAALEAAAEG